MTVTLGLEVVAVDEAKRSGVDAVAQAALGRGSVGEDVPEVAVAVARAHFGAHHDVAVVGLFDDVIPSIGLVKLGQPVPLSNLSTEANSGSPDTTST